MSGNQETVADIIAEKRERADEIERDVAAKMASGEMVSDQYAREVIADLRREAARLDAAWRRDEAHAVEHATHHAEAVARRNCRDCVYNPHSENYECGNAAAMREALCEILYVSEKYMKNCPHISGMIYTGIAAKCRTARAAAPRNCDRYSHDEALTIWSAEKENGENGCFDEWLYATAKNEGCEE